MAPITEKRISHQQTEVTQAAMLKEGSDVRGGSHNHGHGHHHHHQHQQQHQHQHHNNHHHQHAKENASNGRSNLGGGANGKGLEILDFHESWREEMEVYKDMMHIKKHVPHQLLGSHNHAHTPQGCQIDVVNNHHPPHHNHHNLSANKMSSHLTTTTTTSASLDANNSTVGRMSSGGGISNGVNGSVKRRPANDNNKTRVRVTSSLSAASEAPSKDVKHELTNGGSNGKQLHLKRPREETPNKTAGGDKSTTASSSQHNAKRSSVHSSSRAATNSQHPVSTDTARPTITSPSKMGGPMPNAEGTVNNTKSINASASLSSSSPQNMNKKIIVNQFHASSLLNGHQLEEKEKILTQNGLINTSATANEASFYAANYLKPDAYNNHSLNHGMTTHNNSTPVNTSNSVDVSLATNGNGVYDDQADDDPSAAIDDVNYSDSDSDEEYTGEPFYLEADGDETLQSKNIRYQSPATEHASANSANNTSTEPLCDYYTPKTILSPSLFPNVPPYLNYSSHAKAGPSMPPQLHKVLKWKLSPVMPKIVKRVVLNSGFRIIKNTTDWMAIWEKHMKSPGFRTIRSHQKYNHMPGSFRIGRKDSMWRSIFQNMKKFGTKEFGFMQRSYVMPEELDSLRKAWPKNAARLTKWIVKPPASARGTGISIVNRWSQFPKDRPLVVQKYIERPLLINDSKFDMRIYVVVTSINPLRIYMYKDGLARFASVKYSSELNSLDERCMHLTNYSINKFSEHYSINEDFNACQGHKWTLQSLWSCLEQRGVNTKRLWATLRNLVIRALISGEAGLNRTYRQNVNFRYNCFELFGFDVLLDENLIPWLLEINISPSLHSELPLDLHVKGPLIQAVLNTALYQVPPKLSEKQQKEILDELKLKAPLCHDKRIFTTCLRPEEIRKHNQFTNRSIELREEYLDAILEHLQPDDIRCLLVSEDELNRCSPLERIFPTPDTFKYLPYVDNPRYYNRLLDAWEHRYGHCRETGIALLRGYCEDNYHLIVSEAAMEKEPTGPITEIDVLHVKKDETTTDNNDTAIPTTPAADDASATDSQPTSLTNTPTATTTSTPAANVETKVKASQPPANETKIDQKQPQHKHHQNLQTNKESSYTNKLNKTKFLETTDRKLKTDIKAS